VPEKFRECVSAEGRPLAHFRRATKEDDSRRIDAAEMDALRRSARISKLDSKSNEYVREKMYAQYTILDDVTRKQLIWYGHVERMDPTRLPKIMINWKPEGRKKTR
jgi:hypothetical protein